MSAFGWVSAISRYLRRRTPRRPMPRRRTVLQFDALERQVLLSLNLTQTGGFTYFQGNPLSTGPSPAGALVSTQNTSSIDPSAQAHLQSAAQMTAQQPITITQTVQTFPFLQLTSDPQPPLPLTISQGGPGFSLFDPNLGTLQSVTVRTEVDYNSQIDAQNISTLSPAEQVTGKMTGSFTLNKLNQVVTGSVSDQTASVTLPTATPPIVINFQPPTGIMFPALTPKNVQNFTFTDPAILAFYTASAGNTTITPELLPKANATVTSINGNIVQQTSNESGARVTITYTYLPPCPPPPTVLKVTQVGIHHQPTNVIINFQGQVDPVQATNPANYIIVTRAPNGQFGGPGSQTIPVTKAVFDPATDTVTLTTAVHLNVHHKYQITIKIPNLNVCGLGTDFTTTFGKKGDLGPLQFHGRTIQVTNRGPIVLAKGTKHFH
jgi:hypothetical protein